MKLLMTAVYKIHKPGICKPAVNQQIIKRNPVPDSCLDHLYQLLALTHEVFFLASGCMGSCIPFTFIAPFALLGRHPLFLAFHLTLLAMKGNVEHEPGAAITPAQHEGLIPENALLVYMRENLTYRFHPETCLGQVGIICYKNSRKMAPPEILTAGDVGDKRNGHTVNQTTPIDMVLCHE